MESEQAIDRFKARPSLLPLQGAVMQYEWGGYDFIPGLIGSANASRAPFAELWIGAHAMAPARALIEGSEVPLNELISKAPEQVLGPETSRRFSGSLPWLFKVLDAREMLSIQAHPSKTQAVDGFAREEALGMARDAPERCYRDANAKPEIHVALSEFWLLHGFRPLEEIAEVFQRVPELGAIMPDLPRGASRAQRDPAARAGVLRTLFERVMRMPQREVDAILDPLIARLEKRTSLDRDAHDYWALQAAGSFPLPGGGRDRGIVSIYLMNLVRLAPGQGTFQAPGCLHAYLEGTNLELMANSDNILRGGLTPKHMDTGELLRILDFDLGKPDILEGRALSGKEWVYDAPVDEFSLRRIEVHPREEFRRSENHGVEAMIVMEGAAAASCPVGLDAPLALRRGSIFLAPAGLPYRVHASDRRALLFAATLP